VREEVSSISAPGFFVPVLVGKDNLVLDGAIRTEAARLGVERRFLFGWRNGRRQPGYRLCAGRLPSL